MTDGKDIRIDKFLWAVRIYKTRSMATEACRKGRVLINNFVIKPSHSVAAGDIITVKKMPVIWSYRIIEPLGNRVSAKMVQYYLEDLTPVEEKIKLDIKRAGNFGSREKGTGRPTKKERRILDRFRDDFYQ